MPKYQALPVVINCIGMGARLWLIEGDDLVWEKLQQAAALRHQPLEEAITELDFLSAQTALPFTNIAEASACNFNGLLFDPKSHLEIRVNGRKKRMIFFEDLLATTNSLFSLYEVQLSAAPVRSESAKTLAVVEKEMGMIASYAISCAALNLDALTFDVLTLTTDVEQLFLLTGVSYGGLALKSTKNHSVQTSVYSVFCSKGN